MKDREVKDTDYFRHKLIFIRHYFPGVDIENLSDEEFAELANDAEWFNAQQMMVAQTQTLGLLSK
ncbi:hypothetical protein C5O72_07025 [Muribaculum intestinale]|nr:hypothetical protein C5O72_07025 [Muribaculum intestinale]